MKLKRNLFTLSSQWHLILLFTIWMNAMNHVMGYSQIETNQNGPKIFKAKNMDLIVSRAFNSNDEIISTPRPPPPPPTPTTTVEIADEKIDVPTTTTAMAPDESHSFPTIQSTGRAVNHQMYYPFNQLISPMITKLSSVSSSSPGNAATLSQQPTTFGGKPLVIYPSGYQQSLNPSATEINKLSKQVDIEDRFTPGEAVASSQFLKNEVHQNHKPNPSNYKNTYTPPRDLYSFPPNTDASYPLPPAKENLSPKDSITSYLPPPSGPSGPSDTSNNSLPGPVNYDYLPPQLQKPANNGSPPKDLITSYLPPPSGPIDNSNTGYPGPVAIDYLPPHMQKLATTMAPESIYNADNGYSYDDIGVLPANAMKESMNTMNGDFPPQEEARDNAHPDNMHMGGSSDFQDFNHLKNLHPYDTGKVYPTPPPGWMEEQPEKNHSPQDHHHNPDIFYSDHMQQSHRSPHTFDHDMYPDIIYDDHDHDHDHHHVEPLPTETPPEARVKKYSYFYIGRKLWYIPLYFTVWFSFYILWLILKSIARHKVDLPNHYVAKRSIIENYNHREAAEHIDRLTASIMDKIDNFKEKYLQ